MATIEEGAGNLRFNEYVIEREREAASLGSLETPFGLDESGEFVDGWAMNFERIEIFTKYRGFHELSQAGGIVRITVPSAGPGAEPLDGDRQPFGWSGKINEAAADRSVWRAFDLLTDGEAAEFYRAHRPAVVFEYNDRGPGRRLTVRHNGAFWTVEDVS